MSLWRTDQFHETHKWEAGGLLNLADMPTTLRECTPHLNICCRLSGSLDLPPYPLPAGFIVTNRPAFKLTSTNLPMKSSCWAPSFRAAYTGKMSGSRDRILVSSLVSSTHKMQCEPSVLGQQCHYCGVLQRLRAYLYGLDLLAHSAEHVLPQPVELVKAAESSAAQQADKDAAHCPYIKLLVTVEDKDLQQV